RLGAEACQAVPRFERHHDAGRRAGEGNQWQRERAHLIALTDQLAPLIRRLNRRLEEAAAKLPHLPEPLEYAAKSGKQSRATIARSGCIACRCPESLRTHRHKPPIYVTCPQAQRGAL